MVKTPCSCRCKNDKSMKLNPNNRDVHSSFSEGVHLNKTNKKTNLHISEAIENFWHNVRPRREHRFVVKLTACNPDFRRTKPRYVELFRLDILMWTWNFHRLITAWKSWIVNQGIWKSIFQLKKSCFDFLDWLLINPEWISFRINTLG